MVAEPIRRDEFEDVLRDVRTVLQAQQDHIVSLDGLVRAIDEKLDRQFAGLTDRLDGLEQRFDGLEQRFDGLERRFDGLEQRFDGLERRFDGLERRFDGLERQMEEGFREIKQLLAQR